LEATNLIQIWVAWAKTLKDLMTSNPQ